MKKFDKKFFLITLILFSQSILPSSEIKKIVEDILFVSSKFLNNEGKIISTTNFLQFFEYDNKKYFGIHKNKQEELSFQQIRTEILKKLNLPDYTKITQIIGDSAQFSKEGTRYAQSYLYKKIEDKNILILWGFTGYGTFQSETLDTNQLVNNWIDADTSRATRCLANVVDFHTIKAINNWGCNISPNVKNLYIVYDEAKFGDDIISSDSITDIAICLEGGIQSFCQITNFLANDIKVFGISNLRGKKHQASYDPSSKKYLNYFSAAEFLYLLSKKNPKSVKDVENFKTKYLKTRHLFNSSRPDAETKSALFEKAWKKFIEKKLWTKLENCHFIKFNTK